jgi:hypothetical protein
MRIFEKEYFSLYDINDIVEFYPMSSHCEKYEIEKELFTGRITSIRFSNAKVFYNIVDDYYGYLFDNVDSCNVQIKRYMEALSTDDQRTILDLEYDMIDLKRRMLDASSEEKEDLKQQMDNLKQDITDIKERGKEE